ncbi:hypothetical protein N7456_007125 [Penicillium angulare]|uniref:Uncharacterized protein n=1 Tax=Penicillium angulare TaxID=116970 RepID=A0A9W9FJ54_9EURO|nr:hypothetical protein N7456_007125 [Penicillium angulare]
MSLFMQRSSCSYPREARRRLQGDEYYAATAFQDHAEHCRRCADPFQYQMCRDGLGLAKDVVSYLCKRDGRYIGVNDQERGKNCQVDLPRGFDTQLKTAFASIHLIRYTVYPHRHSVTVL